MLSAVPAKPFFVTHVLRIATKSLLFPRLQSVFGSLRLPNEEYAGKIK
jgi:hypothetical protein